MNEPAKRRTLNDIVQDYQELLWHIEELDGEVSDDVAAALDEADEAFAKKVDSCLLTAEKFAAQADVYADRAKRLGEHAKRLKARGQWLKDYVKARMEFLNIQKLTGLEHFAAVAIRANPPSLCITDEASFLRAYGKNPKFVETVQKVINSEVKAALSRGEEVKHAELRRGMSLRVS